MNRGKPLITVGIVTLNREWSIGCALRSLLEQTYPRDMIYVVVVDGGSTDRTVEVASKLLEGGGLAGYKIIVRESTIPEARNICIQEMRGEALLFWDSDVVMKPDAVEKLVEALEQGFDVVTADRSTFYVGSEGEAVKVFEHLSSLEPPAGAGVVEVPFVTMGHTLIARRVLERVRFDPDLTFGEDADFSARARMEGFRLGLHKGALAVDVNVVRGSSSDIYLYSPLRTLARGLRKKARAKVLTLDFRVSWRATLRYFRGNVRYAFYLGYLPAAALSAAGAALGSLPLALLLPFYALFYLCYQVPRRGLKGALKALAASVLVGLPLAALMLYYTALYARSKKPGEPRLELGSRSE